MKAASGALAYASAPSVLATAGISQEKPIVIGNILDQTGGLNIYSLQQIKATAMAVDELNAGGGVLGRPLELVFYDSQSNNQLNAQYMTEALVRDEAVVVHGGVTSSSREVMRPIVNKFGGLYFYNSMYEGGVCDPRHVCPAMVPSQQLKPLVPHVVENMGKRAYVLGADYLYPHTMGEWIKKYTEEAGGEVIATEFFPLDVSNFALCHHPHTGRKAGRGCGPYWSATPITHSTANTRQQWARTPSRSPPACSGSGANRPI